jgi:voltage-gated sodium channel
MTLESWSMGISRPVMEKFSLAYLYFIPFILVATYTTLNIFIAIVVNTMSEIQEEESKRNVEQIGEILHSENADIINELKKIKNQINSLEEKLSRK